MQIEHVKRNRHKHRALHGRLALDRALASQKPKLKKDTRKRTPIGSNVIGVRKRLRVMR